MDGCHLFVMKEVLHFLSPMIFGSSVLGGKKPKHKGHDAHKGEKGAYLTGGLP
jgi:hypothetical protein